LLDGWNVTTAPAAFEGVAVGPNTEAQPENSPVTGLPFETVRLR
jgi:hypothetical protein